MDTNSWRGYIPPPPWKLIWSEGRHAVFASEDEGLLVSPPPFRAVGSYIDIDEFQYKVHVVDESEESSE